MKDDMPPLFRTAFQAPPHASLGAILWHLFFDPASLYSLFGERRRRGIAVMLAAACLAGVMLGVVRFSAFWPAAQDWAGWFGREVGTVKISAEGDFGWERPAQLPYRATHAGWRVDFRPADAPFAVSRGDGPEVHGLWITPREVILWNLVAEKDVRATAVVHERRLFGTIALTRLFPGGRDIPGSQIPEWLHTQYPVMLVSFVAVQTVYTILYVAFYLALFSLIPLLLRSVIGRNGFLRVFSLYGFASVPPLLVAGIYAALGLPGLEFEMLFVIAFILYLFWADNAARRRAEQAEARQGRGGRESDDEDGE